MRDLRVFIDFLSILEVLFSHHCRPMCMLTTCVTITSSTLSFWQPVYYITKSCIWYEENCTTALLKLLEHTVTP